jgi:hypothetical protein
MLYPYKTGSVSAGLLAQALNIKKIKLENSSFKGSSEKLIINWGASSMSKEAKKCKVLNNSAAVKLAANKLDFFNCVSGKVNIPEYTTDKNVALNWLEDGKMVFARTTLTGHSGNGIYVLETPQDWEEFSHNATKIYVKYIPKKDEYRIHIVNGEIIDVRRKSLKAGYPKSKANWKIRSHQNGFIFAKEGFEVQDGVLLEAKKAVFACGLNFGAVDVIWNEFYKVAYVLEINTAPGLEGSTVDNYAKAFNKILKDEKDIVSEEEMLVFLTEMQDIKDMGKKKHVKHKEYVLKWDVLATPATPMTPQEDVLAEIFEEEEEEEEEEYYEEDEEEEYVD